MGKYLEIDLCMPISASCGISMERATWMPWDSDKKELWLSEIPENVIHIEIHSFPFFELGMSDSE